MNKQMEGNSRMILAASTNSARQHMVRYVRTIKIKKKKLTSSCPRFHGTNHHNLPPNPINLLTKTIAKRTNSHDNSV